MNTRYPIALLAFTWVLVSPVVRAQDVGDPFTKIITYSVEQSRKDCAAVEAEVRKATPAQYAALESKLLGALRSPDATADCKNFVCRQLATAGSPVCVPGVAPLLLDEKTSHMARFALEPNLSPAAGAALRAALPQVKGKLLVGVISSIGVRRDAQAVEALAALVVSDDSAVAMAAIAAIGNIGVGDAIKALEGAKVAPNLRSAIATAQITAARHLAAENKIQTAIAVYKGLAVPTQPKFIQIAAIRGLIGTLDKAAAAQLIVQTMQSEDIALRSAPLAAIQDSSESALRNSLAEQLPTFKADAQLALLSVLADQKDVALRGTLLKMLDQSQNAEVRAAAIDGLGAHGEAGDVAALVKFAAGKNADSVAARKALERMGAAGIDNALIQQAQSSDPATQIVVINVIGVRREGKAMDTLVKLMASPDAAVASEAVKAVSTLGTAQQLPTLLGIIAETSQAALRTSAENAAKAICSRATDKPVAGKAILAALDSAKSAPARIGLLRILSRVPSGESLAAVQKAMKESDKDISDAATRELIDWPDMAAASAILDLAKSSKVERDAVLALRGAMRLGSQKDQPTAQRLSIYRSVLETAQRPDEKKQALAGLGDVASVGSLELAQKYLKDSALANDAAMAGIRVARQLGTIDPDKAKAGLNEIKATVTSDELKKQADDALAAVSSGAMVDGYITAFAVSGPYMQEDKDSGALFDIVFAPERANAAAAWQPIRAEGNPAIVGLDKAIGGEQRVAYLRVIITSATAQAAQLELGSDDGIKVLLNGRRVFANNTIRGLQVGSDKVKINLRQGANTLLLKVTQGGGEWTACCRLVSPTGSPLPGISVSAPIEK